MEENNSPKKYILYTIGGIALAALILALVYYFFFRITTGEGGGLQNTVIGRLLGFPEPKPKNEEQTPLPPPAPEPVGTSTIPTIESKLIQLTDFPVSSAMLNQKEDRVIFYKKDGGNMFSYDVTGKIKDKSSNITIVGIFDVAWNTPQNRRVVSYLDQNTVKSFLHIATSVITILPQNIRSPSWSPDGKSLAYLTNVDTKPTLVITDANGKTAKNIYMTPFRDFYTQWITQDRILFETAPSGFVEGYAFIFSRARTTLDKVIKGFGLMTKWSPDGNLALVLKTKIGGKNPVFSLYDQVGNEVFDTNTATTPDKCVWLTAKKAYCAVPRNIPGDIVWPDEYLSGELHTADKIVLINIEKNEVREVFNEKLFDISNLLVTKTENYLLFIDRTDGTLWSIKLK